MIHIDIFPDNPVEIYSSPGSAYAAYFRADDKGGYVARLYLKENELIDFAQRLSKYLETRVIPHQ